MVDVDIVQGNKSFVICVEPWIISIWLVDDCEGFDGLDICTVQRSGLIHAEEKREKKEVRRRSKITSKKMIKKGLKYLHLTEIMI